jgi:hypothetical protein
MSLAMIAYNIVLVTSVLNQVRAGLGIFRQASFSVCGL